MVRLFYVETTVAEADSVEEARAIAASSGVPAGLSLLSERVIVDKPSSIGASADTLEQARAQVHRQVPPGATIESEKVISAPERRTIVVEAVDQYSAGAQAERQAGEPARVSLREAPDGAINFRSLLHVAATRLSSPGRRGFLGIGRRPSQYEVELVRKACVEVRYCMRPKVVKQVGVKIGSAEKLQSCMRGDNLNPHQDFDQAVRELREEGRIGSLALAELIRVCLHNCSSAISWALAAAGEAEPTRQLREVLRSALSAEQVLSVTLGGDRYGPDGTGLKPELIGEREIGWTDGTFRRLKDTADKSLKALARRAANDADVRPGSVIVACERCVESASFTYDGEFLCSEHYRERLR